MLFSLFMLFEAAQNINYNFKVYGIIPFFCYCSCRKNENSFITENIKVDITKSNILNNFYSLFLICKKVKDATEITNFKVRTKMNNNFKDEKLRR